MKPSMLFLFNEKCDCITETLFKERFHLSTESLPDKSKEEVLFSLKFMYLGIMYNTNQNKP